MSVPRTYQAFRRTTGDIPIPLELVTEQLPTSLQPQEVLIRIHAVSLNYRDVAMLHGKYIANAIERGIPASDCAAEVIALGSEVKEFAVGDHVAPIFDLENLTGTEQQMKQLGGDVEGVLRQYAIFDHKFLVPLPKHLTWEEVRSHNFLVPSLRYTHNSFFTGQAACIPCAGCTAWNGLGMPHSREKGKVAMLQGKHYIVRTTRRGQFLTNLLGTGGVSMFGLLICLAAGIHPIITSSSDKKLDMARALGQPGAVDVINYKLNPDWDQEALQLTQGRGVDIFLENVGASTVGQSLNCLTRRGTLSLIGFLGGVDPANFPDTIIPTLAKSLTMRFVSHPLIYA